jgi:hypothetical protein
MCGTRGRTYQAFWEFRVFVDAGCIHLVLGEMRPPEVGPLELGTKEVGLLEGGSLRGWPPGAWHQRSRPLEGGQGDRILNFQQSQQGAALVDDSRADNEITLKPPIYVVTGD